MVSALASLAQRHTHHGQADDVVSDIAQEVEGIRLEGIQTLLCRDGLAYLPQIGSHFIAKC